MENKLVPKYQKSQETFNSLDSIRNIKLLYTRLILRLSQKRKSQVLVSYIYSETSETNETLAKIGVSPVLGC